MADQSLTPSSAMPEAIKQLPIGKGGYRVPATVYPSARSFQAAQREGRVTKSPDDDLNIAWLLENCLCGVCAQALTKDPWIIVYPGRVEANEPFCVLDPAMHQDCALYSVRACPVLAGKQRIGRAAQVIYSGVTYLGQISLNTYRNTESLDQLSMDELRHIHKFIDGVFTETIAEIAETATLSL